MAFTLTAQIKLQNPDNIGQFINQLRNQIGRVNVNVNVAGGNKLNALNKSLTNVSANAKTAANSITGFGEQAALAAKRFFAFSIATNGFLKLIGAIQRGAVDAIAFEKEVYKIAQVTGSAVRDLRDLTSEVTTLSTSLGVTSGKILNAAQVLAQAGLSAEDTKIALSALAKTELSATFDDISNTTEGAIAIFSQFGVKATQLESKLSSINAVAGKFAVESSDLVTAVRRTGGAFQAAGGSLEELISLFTSVRATTRESAESIATGFRTIFTRLQRTKTVTFLEDIGVQLRDFEGQFVGPYEAIRRLSAVLKEIPSTDPRFAQVIEELGGFRQVSKVIPLIQKFSEAEKALVVAQQGQGSLAKDAAQAQGSLANQLAKVREEFDALLRKIANNDAFKGLVQVTTQLATALIKVADAATPLLPFISIIAALKVNKVAPAFFSGFVAKKGLGFNQGGEVPAMKFARGGLVPGTGNTDTVRANLTPGEFVVRKDAVNAIGVNNLHNLQKHKKFQLGGRVEEIDDNDIPTILRIFSQNPMLGNENTDKYVKRVIKGTKIINPDIDPRGAALFADTATKYRGISTASIKEAVANRMSTIKNKDDKQNNKDAKEFAKNLLPQNDRTFGVIFLRPTGTSGDFDTSINGTLIGGQFDGVSAPIPIHYKQASMTNASAKAFEKTVDTQLPDVVNALAGNIARNFGSDVLRSSPTRLNRIPGKSSVMGWLFEGALQSLGAPYQEDADDNKTFDFPGGLGKLSSIFPLSSIKKRPVDAKLTKTDSNDQSLRDKAKSWLIPQLSKVMKFAVGGQAKGTDTVPAVLTPGEFVFTKEAAQGIGYNNLHKLNKAKGYAKGGVVTGYASGGTVSGSSGTGGLFSGTGGIIALAIGIQTLSQQFGTLSKEMQSTIGAVTGIGTNFIIFKGLLDQINPKWNGLSKTSGELSERYKNISSRLTSRKDDLEAKYKSLSSRYVANLQKISVEEAKNVDRLNNLRRQGINLTALATNPKQFKQDLAANPLYNAGNSGTAKNASLRNKALNTSIDEVLRLPAKRKALTNENRSIQFESIGTNLQLNNISRIKQNVKDRYDRRILNAQRQELAGNIGLGVAAASSAIGGVVSEYGAANIRAGSTSTTASGVGGALQGGATGAILGATIGSIVPVIGTALGAALGGASGAIYGFITSVKEAERQIASVRFDKIFKEFNRKISENANISDINAFGKQASNRLSSVSGDDLVTTIGQLESSAVAIDAEFKKIISNLAKNGDSSSKVLERFNQSVDSDILGVFAIATGRTLSELNKDLKKVAESAEAVAKSHLSLVKAVETVADRMNFLANVSNGTIRGSQLLDESSARSNFVTSGSFNLPPSRAKTYLDNPGGFDRNEITNEIMANLQTYGGNNGIGIDLQKKFNNSADLIDISRSILGNIKGKGTIDDAQKTAKELFSTKTSDPALLSAIQTAFDKYSGSTDEPAKFANALQDDFEGVLKTLEDEIKKVGGWKELQQVIELNIKALNEHLSVMNKVNELQKQNTQFSLQKIDVGTAFNSDLIALGRGSQTLNNGVDLAKQKTIFKNDNLVNSPEEAGQAVLNALNGLATEMEAIVPDYKVIDRFTDIITNATDGLNYLADYSTRAAQPLKIISEIRAKRNEANSIIEASSGLSGRRDLFKNLKLLEMATSGQANNIKGDDQVKLIQFLESNRESATKAFEAKGLNLDTFLQDTRTNLFKNRPELAGLGGVAGELRDNIGKNAALKEDAQLAELASIAKTSKEALDQLKLINQSKANVLQTEDNNIELATRKAAVKSAEDILKQEKSKQSTLTADQASINSQDQRLKGIENIVGNNPSVIQSVLSQSKNNFKDYKTKSQIVAEQGIISGALKKYGTSTSTGEIEIANYVARLFGSEAGLVNANGLNPDKLKTLQYKRIQDQFGLDAANLIKDDLGNKASLKSITTKDGRVDLAQVITQTDRMAQELLQTRQDKLSAQQPTFALDTAYKYKDVINKLRSGGKGEGELPSNITREEVNRRKTEIKTQLETAETNVKEATNKLNIATDSLDAVTKALNNFPRSIDAQVVGTVNVNVNGTQVINGIEQFVSNMINTQISAAFTRYKEINGGRPNIPELASTSPITSRQGSV